MRILVDMSVDIRVADWLRSQGHDAVHLRDEGLHRMPNGEIFAKALMEHRIVVTSDLDFGEIAAALKDTAGKVVLMRLQNSRAANVIRRLDSVLPRVELDLAAGAARRRVIAYGAAALPAWRSRPGPLPGPSRSPGSS